MITRSVLACGSPLRLWISRVTSATESARRLAQAKTWRVLLAVLLPLILNSQLSTALAQYSIDWFTIDGGGGTSTGGVYSVSGTIGQPEAGAMSGGTYSVVGGFWSISALQTPGAPLLSIEKTNGAVRVFWPLPAPGFVLEQTPAMTSPAAISWSQAPFPYQTNATHISITVPSQPGNTFYRLRKL